MIEFTNSFNTQQHIFLSEVPFMGRMRIKGGYDNAFKQKYVGRQYVNQPQDVKVLNGIPYEVASMYFIDAPDWLSRKVLRMAILDGFMVDGEALALDEGAEMETVFTPGAPKKIQKMDLRPSNNYFGISTSNIAPDIDKALMVFLNPESLGPNATNESGTTDSGLIEVPINP